MVALSLREPLSAPSPVLTSSGVNGDRCPQWMPGTVPGGSHNDFAQACTKKAGNETVVLPQVKHGHLRVPVLVFFCSRGVVWVSI